MVSSRYSSLAFVCMALVLMVIAGGCTSSGNSSGSSSGSSSAGADPGEFHSSFAPLAGTYVSTEDPSSSITLDQTGAARVVADGSQADTSVYMEMDVLYLADGTSLGPYPVQDDTLVYHGVKYRKS